MHYNPTGKTCVRAAVHTYISDNHRVAVNTGVQKRQHSLVYNINKNSSGDEIANVNFLTTISHTRRPTSKYRKRDKPTSFNKLDDR